jgi:Ca2+-binding RTX toxin-like protein
VLSAIAAGITVDLGAGSDTLVLSSAGANRISLKNVETVIGGSQDDDVTLLTPLSGGTIDLGGGNDKLTLAWNGPNSVSVANAETIIGGAGVDVVTLTTAMQGGLVDLNGGGDTLVLSSAGANRLTVSGITTLQGSSASDDVTLGRQVWGGLVDLGGGADILRLANAGNSLTVRNVETVIGGSQDDVITVTGPVGARLEGGAGNDRLYGGDGNDTLIGGTGFEIMRGGAGADLFVFASIQDSPVNGYDWIEDFTPGTDQLVFTGLLKGSFAWRGGSAFTASSNTEARIASTGWQTVIAIDVDGNGTADMAVGLNNFSGTLGARDFAWS